LIAAPAGAHTGIVRDFRLAAAIAVLMTAATASGQTTTSAEVVSLQRMVFGIGDPAFPDTPAKMDAQLRLAQAYATGTGIAQDVDMACGLAKIAGHLSLNLGDDHPVHRQATSLAGEICATTRDLVRSLSQASCAHFGATQTLEYGPGAWLTVTGDGWTLEDASGTRTGEWGISCYDVVASMRLVRVEPPQGSQLRARPIIEMFVWHQSRRADGAAGDRSLEWYVHEVRPGQGDTNRLASEGIVEEKGELIWPTPPVPNAVADGARFRMLANGDIRWSFDGAPELGTGVIEPSRR
jgi:hypothetical protein